MNRRLRSPTYTGEEERHKKKKRRGANAICAITALCRASVHRLAVDGHTPIPRVELSTHARLCYSLVSVYGIMRPCELPSFDVFNKRAYASTGSTSKARAVFCPTHDRSWRVCYGHLPVAKFTKLDIRVAARPAVLCSILSLFTFLTLKYEYVFFYICEF